jgi:type IV pilus assembly protein PilE
MKRVEKLTTKSRGFSLIELMIAIAIIGLLATIAYQSYRSYLVSDNRAAAQSVITDIARRQQQTPLDAQASHRT